MFLKLTILESPVLFQNLKGIKLVCPFFVVVSKVLRRDNLKCYIEVLHVLEVICSFQDERLQLLRLRDSLWETWSPGGWWGPPVRAGGEQLQSLAWPAGKELPRKGNLNPSHSSQFDVGVSDRCPEPGEGSAEEHLKNSTKEGLPLQPVSQLD